MADGFRAVRTYFQQFCILSICLVHLLMHDFHIFGMLYHFIALLLGPEVKSELQHSAHMFRFESEYACTCLSHVTIIWIYDQFAESIFRKYRIA